MYNVGVFVGKFTPPHRGHINAIINAGTKCKTLYVVVSHNPKLDEELFKDGIIKPIPFVKKMKWMEEEFSELDHIKIVGLDETNIPTYPNGWDLWTEELKRVVPEKFDVIFGGEPEYAENYKIYFPDVDYVQFDVDRTEFPVSATKIRNNPYKYWDYIIGPARPWIAKKVLIVGTESAGKSTLTKCLAKIYNTSWAREEGRYYSEKYFNKNESLYEVEDFYRICLEQNEIERHALRNANKVVFFDTDNIITQYYCELYMGEPNPKIEHLLDPDRYDIIMMLTPDVDWVPDGMRWISDQNERWKMHTKLKQMYIDRGYGDKIIEISGDYTQRLNKAKEIVDKAILKEEHAVKCVDSKSEEAFEYELIFTFNKGKRTDLHWFENRKLEVDKFQELNEPYHWVDTPFGNDHESQIFINLKVNGEVVDKLNRPLWAVERVYDTANRYWAYTAGKYKSTDHIEYDVSYVENSIIYKFKGEIKDGEDTSRYQKIYLQK